MSCAPLSTQIPHTIARKLSFTQKPRSVPAGYLAIRPTQFRPSSRSAPFARFCNRLVKTIWRKAFHLGFLISLLLFMWANHSSFVHRHTSLCDDCFASWGFPFNTYQTGGLAGLTVVLWPGFIANLAIAACTGVCIGWIFNVVLRQTSPRSYSPFKSQI